MSRTRQIKAPEPCPPHAAHLWVDGVCVVCGAFKTGNAAGLPPLISPPAVEQPKKFDDNKLRLDLIPPELLEAAANGLGFGAKKYSAGNWATGAGFEWSRLYGGLQRHLNSFWKGEDIDPESGNHHLDHAACMLAFLIAHVKREHGKDDRIAIGVKPRAVGAK